MTSSLFDRESLYQFLEQAGKSDWSARLRHLCETRFDSNFHGTLPKWIQAWEQLPPRETTQWTLDEDTVAVDGPPPRGVVEEHDSAEPNATDLESTLREFHPWRKGPLRLFDCAIETEWRSDWKWNRLQNDAGVPAVDFQDKTVLDIGCGNGYYGWRMLGEGARCVVGLEPFLLYVMQFEVFRRYAGRDLATRHTIVPCGDEEIPVDLNLFDVAVSMGVLYHRTSPIDHLRSIHSSLRTSGELLLETIVIDGEDESVLVPKGRYAKMRNVWFLPTVPMLENWLLRTGFRDIQRIDVSTTTLEEQRKTSWMTFESLADFLDPEDRSKTIEGYPAPRRAMLVARRA
ncbi:MAG: tRNA 5-methoxyuridine(34)/uridine 5-oxyacetic acid(34) synthase CmoB [Planctomycetota bacterium]